MLECLDHVGTGHELGERRELVDRVQAELLEEQRRGAPQDGLARTGVAADLVDVPATLQGAQHTVGVDPADGRDLRT